MVEQLKAALVAFFGQDPAQQHVANLWLNNFSPTPEAWGAALALVEPGSGATLEQAFFAANMLATKTRNEWGRLSQQQRAELTEAYLAKLRGLVLAPGAGPAAAAAAPPQLVDRLSLLAASAAALGGAGPAAAYLGLAHEAAVAGKAALGAGAPGSAEQAGGEALLRLSLLMLQQLAEEADELDRPRRQSLVVGDPAAGGAGGLAAQRAGVVGLVREVLGSCGGAGAGAGASGGGADAHGAAGPPLRLGLLAAAVRCGGAWVRLDDSGAAGCGMSPGELEAVSPGLLPALLGLLALRPPGSSSGSAPHSQQHTPSPTPGGTPHAPGSASGSGPGQQQQQQLAALQQAVGDLAADLLGPGGRTAAAAAGGEAADVAAAAAAVRALVALVAQLGPAAAAEAAAAAARGLGTGLDPPPGVGALTVAVRVAGAVAERNAGELATGGPAAAGGPGGCELAVQLAQAVLAALGACPAHLPLAETACDYFLALNCTPTAARHPALGGGAPGGLWSALLGPLLGAVAYPPGFSGWEEETEVDEEAFHRFREQQAADLLESMYGQCRAGLAAALVEGATASSSGVNGGGANGAAAGGGGDAAWRRVEAALFCLRAIHLPVKAAALGGRAGELDTPAAASQSAELQALLGRLFTDVCSPSGRVYGLLPHPWLCQAACRLIADYAAWFGKAPDAPLQPALALLLQALSVRPAAAAAAQAFRNLCVRGADRLTADPATLPALAAAAMSAVAPPPAPGLNGGVAAAVALEPEQRAAVVEGLARLAASLPAAQGAEAGRALMAPCVARAQSIATAAAAASGGRLSPAALSALAAELGLMSAVVRFLEFPQFAQAAAGGGEAAAAAAAEAHPALQVLQVAWPVLAAVASEPQCAADPGVAEALCELYKRSLLCAKQAGRLLLPPLLGSLGGLLAARPHAAAFEVLAAAVELYGDCGGPGHAPEAAARLACALEGCGGVMAAAMAAHGAAQAARLQHDDEAAANAAAANALAAFPASSSPGELAAAFLALADRCLLFGRPLLLRAACLPGCVEWACGVLTGMREREPAAAALSFLTHLLSAATRATQEAAQAAAGGGGGGQPDMAPELRARLDALLLSAGPRLTCSLLVAGTDTCPRTLLRPLAGALHGLMQLAAAGAGAEGGGGGGDSQLRAALPGWLREAWSAHKPLADLVSGGRVGEGGRHALRFTQLLLAAGAYPPGVVGPSAAAASSAAAPPKPLPRGRLDCLVADFCGLARGEASEDVMVAYDM
ncbi:hypothetical protein HXX76_012574 [Chlamydomonas incerta]|uniref:Importin N-terminal domain-containing protein n=1 Tax=Chlamydomonas incerta TaxID=51695 RepID=A0A835SH30_CHLIN|nr:hypothetical protein HXX76_012574 [Chlamydomonas incerta]|eukprot:KAG2427058.1 hypothetical protein HXX76_012574 [Chlamydomonas incerta]